MASRDASNNCERKYQCKFCPKSFTFSSELTKHIRVHTGEKPFQCETCLTSFSQLANLNRHHKIHTKGKSCVERFPQLALLLRHETTHTVQEIKDYPQDIPSLTYPVIPFGNQTAVPSSLNANSNQAENIRTSVQLSTKNLTSLSNFLQIPSSNFQEDDIFALNQVLNADDFQQKIQTSFESGNICHANNSQNTDVKTSETFFHDSNNIILVSEESQESLSFGQQISPNCSEGSDAPPPRVKLEFSTNTFVDSRKCFYNPSERNNSSFDLALRVPSDELKVIDIKPDLSVLSAANNINKLSPVYNTISINTADSLNAALQLSSTNQDDFADSQERNYNDNSENVQVPAESIQYFKSESELCFDNNNDLPRAQAATNDFIQGSASGLKSFNNSQLNLSLSAVPSSFHFENSRTYIDCVNSESHDTRRNGSNLDFDHLNISHPLSSEKLEVDQDEALVIGKQMEVDLGHLDCEKDVKVEFKSISEVDSSKIFTPLATHKAQRKLEDEQMTHQENSFDQRKKLVLYLDTKDSQEMESSSKITNSFKFKSSSDSISQNGHIESSDKICRDLESSDIILLSPSSSLQSTSQPSSPLPHSIQKNQVALNSVDKPSISCNFDDGSNQDVLITCESSLEKSLEEETRHQSEFDAAGKIAVEEVSENLSIVIESVFSMNDKDKPGLSARKELSENSLLSSLVVKHSGISDQNKPRSEVEVIDLVDFSPKEMRSDEQHNWAVPLVDIQEITTQKLDAESNFKIQAAEIEDDTSEEPNSASTKIWDIGSLETDSREPLLELTPSFQQTTNNDAKNIPDLPNHVVSLEPSCFTCSCCKEGFSNKSTLLSHLCAPKSPYSPLAEDVDQIHLKPRGQSCEKACETAANSPNLTEFHLSQTEKFTCKYCNKHFSQTSILVKHIETHIDKKPFVCDLCQRPFSQLTNLNHDRKLHFRNRMLHCQFCQRTFPHSFQLLNHLKYHARSIHRSIKALEDKIRQKRRKNVPLKTAEKVSNKSLKLRASPNQKYLKMKPKITQLSKKNVNQSNGRNSLIPVLHLKRSHSDPQFNAISPKNDENLNTQDLCNKEMRKCLIGQKYLNSIEVSGNLTRITSSDSFVENTSAGECANMSRTYGQEEEHVNQIEFAFSVKASEDQSKINTDSGSCNEQFRSENNSSHILENSKSEEANKSLQNVLVQIQPSELFSHIEYRENLPQKDILPIPSSLLQKNHSRDHTTNPDDKLLQTDLSSMQSGFCSVDVTTTAVNSQNISGQEHLSEVIFVTSNSAAVTPDQSSPSNAPVKSGQFHCKICNKSFNQKFILIKHLRTHTGEKPYKCEFCPSLFSQLNNLNRHRKSHLSLGLFPCKFCTFRFSSISELNAHNKKLHIGMKPHSCTFCNKRFSRSSILMAHIRTHTGFVCELCNRAFSQATNLNRHMKGHVPGSVFRCRYCSYTFKQYWYFKKHLKTHIHLGKMSNENAFIRKTKKHTIQQIIPRRTKPSKSNGFFCKLSDSNKHKLTRRIQSFQEKTENLGSKQDSCHITGSYEPATFPDLLKASSFQHCSNIQPYEETLPNITGTPEILAINGHLLPAPNNSPSLQLEMQSVVTPTGLVPNFRYESFQQKLSHVSSENGDNSLHNNVPSNYPFLLTTDQNQITNKSSSSFGLVNSLVNNSESFTKHKVSGRVNAERNNNNNAFVHSDCKSLREADDDNQSKDNSRSDIELAKNYQNNGVGILWRAAHENRAKTNSRSKDHFIDNYETVGESLENEDDTTLVSPVHSLSVNVKLEPEDLNIAKQSESAPKNSNSDSLCRNQSVVPFKEFPCIYCNKLFHHSQVLCRHLRSHHKSEMMTSACQLCQVSFPDSDALNRHRKTCCQLLLPYFCNLCKGKFPNSSELSRHRQRKHPGGVKRYSCHYCTKAFAKNNALTEHVRTHTGEKPFVCGLCLHPFSQAINLKSHQKIHARNGSFMCKYCKASFSQLSHLSRHLHMHAGE